MIKLKDIVKDILTEETVQFCVAACTDTSTATVDKGCYRDCRASGMAPGKGGGFRSLQLSKGDNRTRRRLVRRGRYRG